MDEPLEVSVEKLEDATIVRVAGEVDVATAPELRKGLEQVPTDGTKVIVDLSDVAFLDSTGLGVLVGGWKRINGGEHPARMALVVTRPEILRVLEITGLTEVFDLFDGVAEAMGAA